MIKLSDVQGADKALPKEDNSFQYCNEHLESKQDGYNVCVEYLSAVSVGMDEAILKKLLNDFDVDIIRCVKDCEFHGCNSGLWVLLNHIADSLIAAEAKILKLEKSNLPTTVSS